MVLDAVNFFKPTVSKGRPLLNQVPLTTTDRANIGFGPQQSRKVQFWNWFRSRPELNSPVQIRVDDTITEVEFFKIDGSPLESNEKIDAYKFYNENFLYERFKSFQYDRLVTGSGLVWKGNISGQKQKTKEASITKLKEVCDRIVKDKLKYSPHIKESAKIVDQLFLKSIDEDVRKTRVVDYVASSTMIINHDQRDVLGYIQRINGGEEDFSTEEIIHVPLLRIDGKVDGFSPVESLVKELILVWAIKENMLAYFRNGGTPSKLFILPDAIANDQNHDWITRELQDQGVVENRHGNMVLTGKIEVQDLEPGIKDMDYKELALYVTSNIAYALRIPVGRIPYMIGSSQSGSDAGGLAESGYWSMIESDQRTIEMHVNTQLFNSLGWSMKFKRQSQLNDLRIAQTDNARIDWVTKLNTELKNKGLKVKQDKLVSLISGCTREISNGDVEELSDEDKLQDFESSGLLNRSFLSNDKVEPNESKQNSSETKRQEGLNNAKKTNQSGF